MKKLIMKISVYLTVCMCLVSMIVMAVPGFAAEGDEAVAWSDATDYYSPSYIDGEGNENAHGDYSGVNYYCASSVSEYLPSGEYYVNGVSLGSSGGTFPTPFTEVFVALVSGDDVQYFSYGFGEHFFIPDGYTGVVAAQSWNEMPVLYRDVQVEPAAGGLYYSAYDILKEAFYGDVELTDAQDITLTLMATLAALMVIALPFILLFGIISLCGRWR